MWVISKARLRDFWQSPGNAASEGPLQAWHRFVETASWANWADVKAHYRTADMVGNCTVFNIGGNKFRLITRIMYDSHRVYVLKVMTHAEYSKDKWKAECGCHSPPPTPGARP
jgi:mRNA interferase HigB